MSLQNPVTPIYGTSAKAVTPTNLSFFPPSVIYVGGTGNVAIIPADQDTAGSPAAVTFLGVPAGSVVPCLAVCVMSTNTTATSIVRVS